MANKKYNNGSNRERSIIHMALENGATLGIKGAGSKSYSNNKNLKVDCIIIKDKRIYLIQSKKGKSSKKDRENFIRETQLMQDYYYLEGLYIEDMKQAKRIFTK